MPTTVTRLLIEYLANGVVIGTFDTPVTVTAGGTLTLTDPNWSDASPSAISFQAALSLAAGTSPVSVAVGDLNGDNRPDLAVANRGSSNVSILLGNGDGTFGAASNFGAGMDPFSVALGDVNGDGRLDLAVANNGSNDVSILLGRGDGTFGAATSFGVGTNP
ncbi:MAG TPA: VCBS repeat-containing protein, partial [Candidatus Nitrosotenuis sp.]|nr:VCBS repeat-containing protein [Candidatus Nitrosotenuis sp.]